MIFTGCIGQKIEPKPPKQVEENKTIIVEEEPMVEATIYDWYQNDELIEKNRASKIVVVKSKRVMILLDEYDNLLSRHRISLGENPEGQKLKKGDKKTPEGTYKIIDKRKDKKYYREILISYPNREDKTRAKELGVNPGNGITIHAQVPMFWNGNGDDYTLSHDWTNGCMAMTNSGMNTIWDMVALGTTVEIRE
ncbi:L,D-transpeptidase family protein [Sulfurovum sp. bin170]|nr:L,D-transpeptidase family protein [Sulfurovum sp. bin170]